MKYKLTNMFVVMAAVFSVLALVMNLLIYFGPQSAFIRAMGGIEMDLRVINVGASICSALIAAAYVSACIVTVRGERAEKGWTACLIALITHIIINVVEFFLTIPWAQNAMLQGVDYFANYNVLNLCRNYLETPLFTLALIFMSISFGTLCGRDDQ